MIDLERLLSTEWGEDDNGAPVALTDAHGQFDDLRAMRISRALKPTLRSTASRSVVHSLVTVKRPVDNFGHEHDDSDGATTAFSAIKC
tara:strand:+ start:803 stop:1066 length:264 start_codon:yes stop_codon:yes gene_type:complete